MRILILTCNTGEGHNSAARALKEAFDSAGIYCEIADSLAFFSKKASTFISKWHINLYKKAPAIFGIGYKAAEFSDSRNYRSFFKDTICKGARKLIKKVEEGNFDTVVCTHPFSALTLTRALKKYHLKLDKTYFVATDYTCSPGVSQSELDYYIIPHKSLISDFTDHGIPEEKLFPGGIPVSRKVHTSLSKDESKKELSLPENKKLVLLMCGSMGCGPIKVIARKLTKILKDDEYLVVICGSNRKLYQALRYLDDPGSVRILGFTKNVPLYMNSAELLISKPGGLSTTEAAENNLPMLLIDAVAGCETHNMNFWVGNTMADTREDTTDLCNLVRHLLDNDDELSRLRNNLAKSFSGSSAERIYKFIESNCKEEVK